MWAKNQILEQDNKWLSRDARDFALLNGLVVRYPDLTNDNHVAHMPFSLFPVPISKQLYNESLELQPIVNELTYKIAKDTSFIEQTLENIVKTDEFTCKLLDIHRQIQREGQAQALMSCLLRTDYLLKDPIQTTGGLGYELRQVETNAIAAGMPALSPIIRSMHQYLLTKYRIKIPQGSQLAQCDSIDLIAQAMVDAFNCYAKDDAYILLIREQQSNNFSDHSLIEAGVHKKRPDIRFIRRVFSDLVEIAKLGPNKQLLIEGNKEIALVYFRYCYDPSNFNFEHSWSTRLLIEQSLAIKCPSIQFHLSGAKKFQQVLSHQEQLERFLTSNKASKIAKVSCKFWPLDSGTHEGELGFKIGLAESNNLVLKPQREGGGHNIFGSDIDSYLGQLSSTDRANERAQFILMEHIKSPSEFNRLMTRLDHEDETHHLDLEPVISELGIFGSILADQNKMYSNESGGYFTRSKKLGINEGGISSGNAGISSILLLDHSELEVNSHLYYYQQED